MNDAPAEPHVQYVYDFDRLERVPQGPTSLKVTARKPLAGAPAGSASIVGPVLAGARIVCTMHVLAAGTGSSSRARASERFIYVVRGTMLSDIEGDRVFATKGMVLHAPSNAAHSILACPDDDLVFLEIGRAADGANADETRDELESFAGYGSRAHEPRVTTAEVIAESAKLTGPGKRYVYDMLRDREPATGPASAEVTPDAQLRLPPHITGKLVSGERLHVGLLRLERRAILNNYRRDNEQLVFVVEGELDVHIAEEHVVAPLRSMLHIPAGARHELTAHDGALILIAQDSGA